LKKLALVICLLVATLIWNPNDDNVKGYRVYSYSIWHHANGQLAWKSRDVGSDTYKVLKYLKPGYLYVMTVTAYDEFYNESPSSEPVFYVWGWDYS
jgi:hypothetical protein